MFNVGDRVLCNSGGMKGQFGTVIRQSTPFNGMDRIMVQFDKSSWECNIWAHRFTLVTAIDKAQVIINKIKVMEARQSWKNLQS